MSKTFDELFNVWYGKRSVFSSAPIACAGIPSDTLRVLYSDDGGDPSIAIVNENEAEARISVWMHHSSIDDLIEILQAAKVKSIQRKTRLRLGVNDD